MTDTTMTAEARAMALAQDFLAWWNHAPEGAQKSGMPGLRLREIAEEQIRQAEQAARLEERDTTLSAVWTLVEQLPTRDDILDAIRALRDKP